MTVLSKGQLSQPHWPQTTCAVDFFRGTHRGRHRLAIALAFGVASELARGRAGLWSGQAIKSVWSTALFGGHTGADFRAHRAMTVVFTAVLQANLSHKGRQPAQGLAIAFTRA